MDDPGAHVAPSTATEQLVEAFWQRARFHAGLNSLPGYFGPTPVESVPPPSWSFGATPEQSDELAALVMSGAKTATASAYDDYEAEDVPLPETGTLGIVLDGQDRPQALVVTTAVRVVPFDEVDAEHARAEGEGDGSLEEWRRRHEEFFAAYAAGGHRPDMPVVLERFEVLHRVTD